jgi:hypothetical protein
VQSTPARKGKSTVLFFLIVSVLIIPILVLVFVLVLIVVVLITILILILVLIVFILIIVLICHDKSPLRMWLNDIEISAKPMPIRFQKIFITAIPIQ